MQSPDPRLVRRVPFFVGSALALFALPLAAQKNLVKRLDARLDAPPWNRHLWGVALVDESGKLLFARNADRLFIPASNTKIVVSAVATALLAPEWTVRTSVYATGPVVDGAVQGDLVLYGRGDPTMDVRCYAIDTSTTGACQRDPFSKLQALAESLRARGVRTIIGDLVGDGSYFAPEIIHSSWEAFDLNWWYAAPVSGLGFHDNSVDITWRPGAALGAPALITLDPMLGDLGFENRTVTIADNGETTVPDRMFRDPGSLNIWAEGDVALNSDGGVESFALPDPNLYTARAFRKVLSDAGIAVRGATRSTTDSLKYLGARGAAALAEVESRPLKDWIFPILNTSQNWFAEMLLKQLGRQFGHAGSWQEGVAVERRFLIDSVGADSTQFELSDGSGLSSVNLISPLTFTQVLRFIRRHPRYGTFVAGLPQSGVTGSLHRRFVGTPLEGRVRAKTGSISRVNTLSGFIELDQGRFLTFSVEANNHTQPYNAALAEIDSVVVDMVEPHKK